MVGYLSFARYGGTGPVSVLASVLGILALVGSSPAEADGAFVVDGSEIAKPGACKVESWTSFADNADFLGVTSPSCVVNLGQPVELGFSLARFRSAGEWGSELLLKGKTEILPAGTGKIGLALSGAVSFDLVSGEFSAGTINVPATLQISEQFKINLNAGWLYDRAEDVNWFAYGAGFEWSFAKQVTLIGEMFGFAGQSVEPLSRTDPRAQVGLRFTPVKSYDIDIIYGRNVLGENANWITVGLNLRFDTK